MAKEKKFGITVKKEEDFSEWYTQITNKAELVDLRYNLKGFPVLRPWCVRTMKKMYKLFEDVLERKGHDPLIMPALIPERNFHLEAKHVEGFTPEVFWVTEHGAGEKFEERLAMRPTSETVFYQMFSKWIRSYNDLPLKTYQSCQVWRYEGKATRPFLRTREFHWIEAHDAFASLEEAEAQVIQDMETTKEVMFEKMGIPFIFFQRPEWDKFAGAVHTYAADALMPSGKVLQLPSTHLLGQNFSKPFNVKFKNNKGEEEFAYITCYGPAISRIYGGLISLHGDNQGLVLPFELAPYHIVIVPIIFEDSKEEVLKKSEELKKKLKDYDVLIDKRENVVPGYKFGEWEMKGVPVRIELGPKDLESGTVVIFRRDLNKKETVKLDDLEKTMKKIEKEFTKNLIKKNEAEFKDNIVSAKTIDEIKKAIDSDKIVKTCFCSIDMDGEECAGVVEKDVQAFVRGKRVDEKEKAEGNCTICGKPAKEIVYIARSY